MGANASTSKKGLEEALSRAEGRVGKITITGRYHRNPKKLTDDYEVEKTVLGSGYNGSVFMAKTKTGKEKYAVKAFKLNGVPKEKKEELVTECEIFLAMDHPHVARLVDVYESEEKLDLVMECMSGGELFQRVTERKRFSERDAAEAVRQMLLAINYIHSHGVVHRDLKLENFLYESNESNHLKLIDFGFSKVWHRNTKMDLSCGTLAYVAPEVLDKDYTSQCDLWSLGVIVFILLVGYMPFSGTEQAHVKAIKSGKYLVKPDKWKTVSDTAQAFVKALLVVKPTERLTAEQAMQHAFVLSASAAEQDVDRNASIDQATVDALCSFGQASKFRRACMNVMAWSLTNEERKQVRDAFLELDQDKTGTVKLWEFKKVMEDQFHVSDEQAISVFHALDAGHTDEIHYSEFLAAMCSSRIALHDDLLKSTFRRLDTDNTGFITVANLKEVLGGSFDGEEVEEMLKEADLKHEGKISLEDFIAYMKDPGASESHINAAGAIIDNGVSKGEKETTKTVVSKSANPKAGQADPQKVKLEEVKLEEVKDGSTKKEEVILQETETDKGKEPEKAGSSSQGCACQIS